MCVNGSPRVVAVPYIRNRCFGMHTNTFCAAQFMENGALSNIIKPSRFGTFPEPLVAMYISQVEFCTSLCKNVHIGPAARRSCQ